MRVSGGWITAALVALTLSATACSKPSVEEELIARGQEDTTLSASEITSLGQQVCDFRRADMDYEEIFHQIADSFGPSPVDPSEPGFDMRRGPAVGFSNLAIRAYCPDLPL